MIEAYARPLYQKILVDPVAEFIDNRCSISASKITCLAAVFGILVAPALWLGFDKVAIVLLLFSGYLDTLDGTIARLTYTSSDVGAFLDIMADRMVELSVIVGLFLVDPERGAVCLIMLGSVLICVTSFLLVAIFSENGGNKNFHYSPGLMERPEAFSFFIAMILLPQYFTSLGIIFAILVFATAFSRAAKFILQSQPA